MISVFYDANAIFMGGDRDRVYPAGSLRAFASGNSIVIENLHSTQALVDADFSQIVDINGNGFSLVSDCLAYLQAEFSKRRPLAASYTQGQPSPTWTIAHGLGFYPNVTVIDTAGDQVVLCDAAPVDMNTVILTFGVPTTGTAYLS